MINVHCPSEPMPEDQCPCPSPTANITLRRPTCNETVYPTNFHIHVTDSLTHKQIPGAKVKLTLQQYDNNQILEVIGNAYSKPAPDVVSFLVKTASEFEFPLELNSCT